MKIYLTDNRSRLMVIGLLILIIGLGSFLRFYQIGKLSFWLDEASTFYFSSGSFINLVTSIKDNPNMSLYFVLAFLWMRILPNASDGTLRAFSAILSVACIPVVFLLGMTMMEDRKKATTIGLIAAFLVTVNAFNIQFAQEFRAYSLTFLLTTLSTFFLIKGIEDTESKHHWLVWYTIVTAAAIYSHFFAVFIVAAQVVTLPILLFDKNKQYFNIKRMLYSGIGLACFIVPIAILAYQEGSGTISWIPKPSFGSLKTLAVEITGKQGKELFAFYLLFGFIGFLFGEGFGFRRNLITIWKYTLIANCLLLPVITPLVISYFLTPIFHDKYILYVIPYLAILAATGIVAVANFGWKSGKYRSVFVAIGICALAVFALLSAMGIRYYFVKYQKEDWRNVTQLLATRCSKSLRLYYANFVDIDVLYYNPALYSQEAKWFENKLQNNPDSEELAASFPNQYSQVCLVLSHAGNQQEIVQGAIQKKYPNVSTVKFYEVEVDIYSGN